MEDLRRISRARARIQSRNTIAGRELNRCPQGQYSHELYFNLNIQHRQLGSSWSVFNLFEIVKKTHCCSGGPPENLQGSFQLKFYYVLCYSFSKKLSSLSSSNNCELRLNSVYSRRAHFTSIIKNRQKSGK